MKVGEKRVWRKALSAQSPPPPSRVIESHGDDAVTR